MQAHTLWVLMTIVGLSVASAASLPDLAREFQAELKTKVMPYWHDTTLDRTNGGYLLADDATGRRQAKDKAIVAQSRMVWGFSHARLKGLSDGRRNYLEAAGLGVRFLRDQMLDKEHGGYYWRVDLTGKPLLDRKIMYGQSFVIYGLVEYHRASKDPEALRAAMNLFRLIQEKAHDPKHGGWIEHFTRDWQPILIHDDQIQVELGGHKSANTHLHLMEAFTELYEVTRDAEVKKALIESLEINMKHFYPPDPAKACFHRKLDWAEATGPQSAGLSYGHNVEFAWLMIRAQQVLGIQPAWNHFYAHLDHALKYGYDWQRGGLYHRGVGSQPATDTDKVWWAEAELMAALSDALAHKANPTYADALEKQIQFLRRHQINPSDGIWLDTIKADGSPKSGGKAHNWKANYHDVRALVKFIEVFGGKP